MEPPLVKIHSIVSWNPPQVTALAFSGLHRRFYMLYIVYLNPPLVKIHWILSWNPPQVTALAFSGLHRRFYMLYIVYLYYWLAKLYLMLGDVQKSHSNELNHTILEY